MSKILILGASGMLGSIVFDYFDKHADHEVKGTLRDKNLLDQKKDKYKFVLFEASQNIQEKIFKDFEPDYIINCIGITKPYCKDNNMKEVVDAIRINAWFPHYLAQAANKINAKVIQIATDCVYSGKDGKYKESALHDCLDVYGKTKSLGEVLAENFLNLRCSIIGPELKSKLNLLEWFLNQPIGEKLKGFSHHNWNGVTTLQFAKLCKDIIDKGDEYFKQLINTSYIYHFVPNQTVNKFELLNIFNRVFGKNFEIEKVDNIGSPLDRTLKTEFNVLENNNESIPMEEAIKELKDYIIKADFYNL